MSSALIDLLDNLCTKLSIEDERIPSGAGHDAAVFANNGVHSAMTFVRNENGSRKPYERMDMDEIFLGVDVGLSMDRASIVGFPVNHRTQRARW